VRLEAQAKGLAWKVEIDPGVPRIVLGDGRRVVQALRNLVANAVKFTESGTVVVQVGRGQATPISSASCLAIARPLAP
jgi:signal transduction histidine kinase